MSGGAGVADRQVAGSAGGAEPSRVVAGDAAAAQVVDGVGLALADVR